uniref:Uncharacterized protein n=1 Tax=Arion vulgaris TaxID=1028688 RepID=A0A0B6Z553_9EUPU
MVFHLLLTQEVFGSKNLKDVPAFNHVHTTYAFMSKYMCTHSCIHTETYSCILTGEIIASSRCLRWWLSNRPSTRLSYQTR